MSPEFNAYLRRSSFFNHRPFTFSISTRSRDFILEFVNLNREIPRALYRENLSRTVRTESKSSSPTRSQMENFSIRNNQEFSHIHMISTKKNFKKTPFN